MDIYAIDYTIDYVHDRLRDRCFEAEGAGVIYENRMGEGRGMARAYAAGLQRRNLYIAQP